MAAATNRKSPARKTTPKAAAKPAEPAVKPSAASRTYTVVDDVLHYTTKAGDVLAIDLDFDADLIKLATGTDEEDRSEEQQYEIMARSFGENYRAAYERMGIIERTRLQKAVFTEFAKAMGMPMGESSGSSGS